MKGGLDLDMPILVSRVAPNTPADRCYPKLNEGDQVLNHLIYIFIWINSLPNTSFSFMFPLKHNFSLYRLFILMESM